MAEDYKLDEDFCSILLQIQEKLKEIHNIEHLIICQNLLEELENFGSKERKVRNFLAEKLLQRVLEDFTDSQTELQKFHQEVMDFLEFCVKLEILDEKNKQEMLNFHLFLRAEKTQKLLAADVEYQEKLVSLTQRLEELGLTWELQ